MKPLVQTGRSANLVYYRERGERVKGYVWCEVLVDSLVIERDVWKARRVPIYYVTVYRDGIGEIARVKYEPKHKPTGGAEVLPERTVTKIVRALIDDLAVA